MPIDPRSWTANSSIASSTSASPYAEHAVTASSQLLLERRARDVELCAGRPCGWIRGGLEDRSTARGPPFVDSRAESVIDLFEQHGAEGLGSFEAQPALLEVFGKSSQSAGRRVRHG